jgi:hypothetical protein
LRDPGEGDSLVTPEYRALERANTERLLAAVVESGALDLL